MLAAVFLLVAAPLFASADDMPWVVVANDKQGFALEPSDKPFAPWGFNYDRGNVSPELLGKSAWGVH